MSTTDAASTRATRDRIIRIAVSYLVILIVAATTRHDLDLLAAGILGGACGVGAYRLFPASRPPRSTGLPLRLGPG